mmetsp:Transcript_16696/g.33742  ORF Transcript_16696/g.33742 Transcript_16696/m.33742 type:complete len:228 (-) Transcript_16696:92-775(-)
MQRRRIIMAHVEGAMLRAREGCHVRPAAHCARQVNDERAYVGATAAANVQLEAARGVGSRHAQLVHFHTARLHLLLGDLALAREVVHALAPLLDGREDGRPLHDLARQRHRRLAQRLLRHVLVWSLPVDEALGILRVGFAAELRDRGVRLNAVQITLEGAATLAHADDQQSRRHRVERAAVAHLEFLAAAELVAVAAKVVLQGVPHLGHHIEAGPILRLVHHQYAVG